MGQQQTATDTNSWYLIADRGDTVVRVRPGMRLGESPAGDLSFDPSHAQLELNIGEDGDLVIHAIDGHELETGAGKRSRDGRLAGNRRAVIRLPNNDLQLDTDFVDPARTDDTPEILSVYSTGYVSRSKTTGFPAGVSESRADTGVPAGKPHRNTARPIQPSGRSVTNAAPLEAKQDIPLPQRARLRTEPTVESTGENRPYRRVESDGIPQRRILGAAAALIALTVVSLVLVLTDFSDEQAPSSLATINNSTPGSIDRRTAPAGTEQASPDAETESRPSFSPSPSPSPALQRPIAESLTTAEPDAREEPAEQGAEASSMPESVITATQAQPGSQPDIAPIIESAVPPIIDPEVSPPVERLANTPSEPTVAAATTAPKPAAEPVTSISEPAQSAPPEPEQADNSAQRLAAQLDRDLSAADQALADGRLVAPPRSNAYTLYSRVVTLDPSSEEAKRGLQAVRQGLINRALAQLASSAFDDARGTLQAAADSGANQEFVADLRGELDYRQRLTDAQAGRFESLYPFDQLVAISQEPPRLPRNAPAGAAVEVQFTVSETGEVRDATLLDAAPRNLERALLRAIAEWRFEPVLYNGGPIPVRSTVRFTFPD